MVFVFRHGEQVFTLFTPSMSLAESNDVDESGSSFPILRDVDEVTYQSASANRHADEQDKETSTSPPTTGDIDEVEFLTSNFHEEQASWQTYKSGGGHG